MKTTALPLWTVWLSIGHFIFLSKNGKIFILLNVVKVNQDRVGKSGLHIINMLYKYNLYLDKFFLSMQLWNISEPVMPSPGPLLTWRWAEHASAEN